MFIKKALLFGLVCMVLSPAVNAAEIRTQFMKCDSVTMNPDHGLMATLDRLGPKRFEATLKEQTIAGPRLLGKFSVVAAKPSRLMGAPLRFTGKNFDLAVNFTTTPDENGRHRGHLNAEVKRQRFADDVNCALVR